MSRNRAVASTAITKAVSGATTGKYKKPNLKSCGLLAKTDCDHRLKNSTFLLFSIIRQESDLSFDCHVSNLPCLVTECD